MLIHSDSRAEKIRCMQEQYRRDLERLAEDDPEKARLVALCNLQSAGILSEDGELTPIYTDDSDGVAPLAFTRIP